LLGHCKIGRLNESLTRNFYSRIEKQNQQQTLKIKKLFFVKEKCCVCNVNVVNFFSHPKYIFFLEKKSN